MSYPLKVPQNNKGGIKFNAGKKTNRTGFYSGNTG